MVEMRAQGGGGSGLTLRLWGEEEFAASKEAWDALLDVSDADPLFMSWDWQWRWWAHHREALGAELTLLSFYAGSRLVGLAPFYRHQAAVRGLLHPRRMELIGIAWRNPRAAFSDYLDIIVSHDSRGPVLEALAAWLGSAAWDDLVLCCTRRGSVAGELAERHLSRVARVREVDPLNGWCATLPAQFTTYLERLDPEVRRRVFNQRRKLHNPVLHCAARVDIPEYLDQMWRYLGERWGGQWREFEAFYRDIAATLQDRGQLRLSSLKSDEGTISVMLNALADKKLYYLQSGFDSARSRGISPGYLHFGYAIEAACDEGVEQFDFLGGSGQHKDYKRDLLTENIPLVTYHVVRGMWARLLYAAHAVACAFTNRVRIG